GAPGFFRPSCRARGALRGLRRAFRLDIEAEIDDVAVGDDVLLALEAELPGLADLGFGLEREQVLDAHHLGADEAALDVRVNLPGRAVGVRALLYRPGAALVGAGGEEADEVQQRERGADEAVAGGLGEAERADELLLLVGRHVRDVLLDLRREDDEPEAARLRVGRDGGRRRLGDLALV